MFTCAYGIGIIPAIVALALAPSARREIEASNGWVTGKPFIKAGVICAWIAVGIAVLSILALIALFAIPLALENSAQTITDEINRAS